MNTLQEKLYKKVVSSLSSLKAKNLKFLLLISISIVSYASDRSKSESNASFNLEKQVSYYKKTLTTPTTKTKLTNNHGNGNESLYGTRNFRVVLHGVFYRGGANNKFNKHQRRDNQNPLPPEGLSNLCKAGFSQAIYFYNTGFETAAKTTSCATNQTTDSTLTYSQISSLKSGNEITLIEQIFKHIKGELKGPLYGHCWNGWHASGYAAAISLIQFCKWNNLKALDYWIENTDGNDDVNYQSIKNKIRNFKPFTEFEITDHERNLICPN